MRYENQIYEAFASNGIEKILLIDDAYDPPEIDEGSAGQIQDFLESDEGRSVCDGIGVSEERRDAAIDAVRDGNFDSDELQEIYRAIFCQYRHSDGGEPDPGGFFHTSKKNSLERLRPLSALLSGCNDTSVIFAGFREGLDKFKETQPQILFLDYLGKADISPHQARNISQSLLKQIVNNVTATNIPAIVLMSSSEVRDAEKYRQEIGDNLVLSLRFRFLKKEWITKTEGNIKLEPSAADTLLDTVQGYLFGSLIQQALNEWKKGAEYALENFLKHVGELHMMDFSYLLRFRLREEGQPFNEYLEWFFGECLKGFIEEKVNWSHLSFQRLGEDEAVNKIEGAFDGPSDKIAKLYHLVRINDNRAFPQRSNRLGDIYKKERSENIRVVITPDCDLIERKGRAKVEQLLTMEGKLSGFDKGEVVIDEFLVLKNRPYSVQWNVKSLQSFPLKGDNSLVDHGYELIGTLRPLYAQDLQRKALTDLSRIGLPIAPAMGIDAKVRAWVRSKTDGLNPVDSLSPTLATVIPSRAGGNEGHRVLLRRSFLHQLMDYLETINSEDMERNDAENLKRLRREDGTKRFFQKLLYRGATTKGTIIYGVGFVLGTEPDGRKDAPWLQIGLEIADWTMKEHQLGNHWSTSEREDEG